MQVLLSTGRTLIDPDRILAEIGAHGRVFADLAAGGHGHFVMAASRQLREPGRVIALNAHAGSHAALLSRISEYQHDRVEAMRADLEADRGTPLNDGEVEVALLANALHTMTSPLKALTEIARILAPQGILAYIGPKEASPFFALAKTRGIGEDTARYLFEEHGFACERRFEAGPHHICLVFRRSSL